MFLMAQHPEECQNGKEFWFIITDWQYMTWMEILKTYASIVKEQTGKNIILYTSHEIGSIEMLYEGGYNTIYDRQWNRRFDNDMAEKVC